MATREEELIATVERQRRETEANVERLRRQIEAMKPYLCGRCCNVKKIIINCPHCGEIIRI